MTTWWPYARLAAAALALAAIIGQLALSLSNAMNATTEWGGHLPTVAANFLSFFTIAMVPGRPEPIRREV